MNRTFRTNIFVLIMMVTQLTLSFFWYWIVTALSLGYAGQLVLTQLLVFVLPGIFFLIFMKEPLKEVLSIHPISFKNVILIIIISIFIQPMMSLMSALSSIFFNNSVSDLMAELYSYPFPVLLFSMAVAPAICEELFFRGLVFSGYKNLNIKKAILVTGLLFGLMHMDGQQFLYAFVMGCVFCYLVYKTKSIFASIISHFTINATQLLLSQITFYAMDTQTMDLSATPTIQEYLMTFAALGIMILFTLPVLILAFWFFQKINKPQDIPQEQIVSVDIFDYSPMKKYEEKVFDLPFFMILLIYVLIVIVLPILFYQSTI